jgi:hypothetical protein
MSNAAACVIMKEVTMMEPHSHTAALLPATLPLEQLIELVESELRELLRYDGFEYADAQGQLRRSFGTPRQHRCQYRITIGDQCVGLVTLSRSQPFDAAEINLLEGALSALIVHLHNALEFQRELGSEAVDGLRLEQSMAVLR